MNEQDNIMYSKDERKLIEAFIEYSFGKISYIIGDKDHDEFNIAVIEPNEMEDYYKFVSIGGGAKVMNVAAEFNKEEFGRAELVMLLPKETVDKDGGIPAIMQMIQILETPSQMNTWIGFGHTFTDGTPLTEETEMKTIGLINACDRYDNSMRMKIDDKIINYYQMIPMYDEEVLFKQRTDMREFLYQLQKEEFPPMFDIKRKNRCKQRIRDKGMEMLH